MTVLLEWFITLPAWKCITYILGLIAAYFVVKFIASRIVNKNDLRQLIFKLLFIVRIASEFILTMVAIWASVLNYQLTHILFSSLLIALLLPFLILLNHRIEDQILYEENKL